MPRRIALLCALLALALGVARAEGPLCVAMNERALLVDESGGVILGGEGIEDAFAVRPGALYAAGRKGDYRLYDASGAALGEASFAMIEDAGDCLIYRRGARYGAMDAQGSVLLDADWSQLTPDGAGGWLALDTDLFDESPDEILRVNADGDAMPTGVMTSIGLSPLRDGCMPFMAADGRFGAIDARGEVVIPATWRAMGAFRDGLSKVSGENGMGMIDAEGAVMIEPMYAWLERGEGFIAGLSDAGVDIFAPNGALIRTIPGEGLSADVAGDRLIVRDGGEASLYDASGARVGGFGAGTSFAAGVDGQLIASDGAWGEACVRLVDPDGADASPAFQDLLPLCPGRYTWLRLPGSEYFSPDLNRLQTSWDYSAARWGLIDGAGNVLLDAEYLEIRALSDDRLLLVGTDQVALADENGATIRAWLTAEGEAATGEAGA